MIFVGWLLYLLSCARWQQLNCIYFLSRDTTWEKDGILLSILVEKCEDIFNLLYVESIIWLSLAVPMPPGCQPRSQVACLQVLEEPAID